MHYNDDYMQEFVGEGRCLPFPLLNVTLLPIDRLLPIK